ncbi:MAG: hypothetical protein ACAH80_14255 [Alphaproteobacteria bacterium]|jgi:hypothetical protein
MSGNTAKILDFEAFRATRQRLTVVEAVAPAPEIAPQPNVWPVYWVFFPAIYVASGF